jgi:beta-glucosidase-like glycosyl hydrolase
MGELVKLWFTELGHRQHLPDRSTPASCFPCGTGLAASFDVELVEKVGVAMGEEARAKSAHIILGPTINCQRSPLGGRGFESYSEDPLVSGMSVFDAAWG